MKQEPFKVNLHDKQLQAYLDDNRIVLCCSGIQGGKSLLGALKTLKAVRDWPKEKYPEASFAVVSPDFKTMNQATRQAFDRVFKGRGSMNEMKQEYTLADKRKIFFRTIVKNPNAVEGIPNCVFIWGDEAGLYPRLAHVNIQGRTAFMKGQVVYTTTPYAQNWVKKEVIDAKDKQPSISYYEWRSVDNPAFPKDEFERQKQLLSKSEFERKYCGIHTQAEGLIYDCVSDSNITSIQPGNDARIFAASDWGFSNPWGVLVRAVRPDGSSVNISEFKKIGLTPDEKLHAAKAIQQLYGIETWFCDPEDPAMIALFNQNGLTAIAFHDGNPEYKKISMGIQAHYALLKTRKHQILEGKCPELEDEYSTYKWDLDINGVNTGKPVKENDHLMDCERMLTVGTLFLTERKKPDIVVSELKAPDSDDFNPTESSGARRDWDEY